MTSATANPVFASNAVGGHSQMLVPQTRWKHFTAMILIGDGVMALIHPEKDALAWKGGPVAWQKLMHELHQRPNLTRAIGIAQIATGIWWALQQESDEQESEEKTRS